MRYIQIAGFMQDVIKASKDLSFVANPSIDIEKMEAEEITGFDFRLPNTIFPEFYQDDDYEVLITNNLSTTDTIIEVDDSSFFSINDYVWLKNEVLKIVSIDSSTQITVLRGQYKTFSQKYTINNQTQQYYYIRKYPKTFIGQRVFLYENDKLLSIGLIESQPSFNNSVLEFNCTNAIECLDVNWTFPAGSDIINYTYIENKKEDAISTLDMNRAFNYATNDSFEYEIPPIFDYIKIIPTRNIIQGTSDLSFMLLKELPTILEYLNLYAKVNGMVFSWDYSKEVYTFINVSDVSSLDTITDVYLSRYKDIKKSYKSMVYTGISQISIKLWNTLVNVNNTNTSQFASKDIFEIDLSKVYGIETSDVNSIIFFYIRLFSIIYSELTIPTHAIKFDDFEEGSFYNILDINKFYTFQNVSSKAFCLSKDEDNIKFLITRDVEKNMIAPGLSGEIIAGDVFNHDNNIQDFLETNETEVQNAKIDKYDFRYFDKGDKVMFIKDDGSKIAGLEIADISNTAIKIIGGTLTIGDIGYFTYDNYSVCTSRQRKFFFLNVNNW